MKETVDQDKEACKCTTDCECDNTNYTWCYTKGACKKGMENVDWGTATNGDYWAKCDLKKFTQKSTCMASKHCMQVKSSPLSTNSVFKTSTKPHCRYDQCDGGVWCYAKNEEAITKCTPSGALNSEFKNESRGQWIRNPKGCDEKKLKMVNKLTKTHFSDLKDMLQEAVIQNEPELLKILITDYGVNFNDDVNSDLLIMASAYAEDKDITKIVKILLDAGINVNASTPDGNRTTALIMGNSCSLYFQRKM